MARSVDDKMPFMEHLGELRVRIVRSLLALLVGLGVTLPFSVAPVAPIPVAALLVTPSAVAATVTVRVAVAVAPAESVTVAASVWEPFATVPVFQVNDGFVPV